MAEELKSAELVLDDLKGEFSVIINGKRYEKLTFLSVQFDTADDITIKIVYDEQDFTNSFKTGFKPVKVNLNIKQITPTLTKEEKKAIGELVNKAQKGDLDSIKAIKAILKK